MECAECDLGRAPVRVARPREHLEGADEFRGNLCGKLTVTMLHGVGHGFEVHELDPDFVRRAATEMA